MNLKIFNPNPGAITGLELLIRKYKKIFRIPENLDYYTKEDYKSAERKFVKWALAGDEPRRAD